MRTGLQCLQEKQLAWLEDVHGQRNSEPKQSRCTVQVQLIEAALHQGYKALNPQAKHLAAFATGSEEGLMNEDHLIRLRMMGFLLEIRV